MEIRKKIRNIFLYLLSIKNMDKNIIREISKYHSVLWLTDFITNSNCNINSEDCSFEINKDCGELYSTIFSLYSSLEKNSEDLELILGKSILSFKVGENKIFHPLFSSKLTISFDSKNTCFLIKPYNDITIFELGVLEGLDLPNFDKLLAINERIKAQGIDDDDSEDYRNTLLEIINCISVNADHENAIIHNPDISTSTPCTEAPVIYNSSCIILRNLDTRLWDAELKQVLKYIDEGKPIPRTIEALVSDEGVAETWLEAKEWESVGKDILFPLAANEEQEQITKLLAKNYGVVVQGPPGTGKSQSIANLVCHLVAHGKRVLVTSQTDKALKVLSDKIPEEIRALCISVLGNDAAALNALDESVRKITENLALDANSFSQEAILLEEELRKCRLKKEHLHKLLNESEALESRSFNIMGEGYKLLPLAKWLVDTESSNNWIEDNLNIKAQAPLTSKEFESLIQLMKSTSYKEAFTAKELYPIIKALPSYDEIIDKLNTLKRLEASLYEDREIIENWEIDVNKDYDELLKHTIKAQDKLQKIDSGWLKFVMKDYYNNEASKLFWTNFINSVSEKIAELNAMKQKNALFDVSLPKTQDLDKLKEDLILLNEKIDKKDKISKVFRLFNGQFNYILDEATVDHQYVSNSKHCVVLLNSVEKTLLERNLKTLWNNTIKDHGGKIITSVDNLSRTISDHLMAIEDIIKFEEEHSSKISALLSDISLPIEIDLLNKGFYCQLERGLKSARNIRNYDLLQAELKNVRANMLKHNLLSCGAKYLSPENSHLLRELYDSIQNFINVKEVCDGIDKFLYPLKNACPIFCKKLINQWENDAFDIPYKNFYDAWKWRIGSDLLKDIYSVRPESLEKNIELEELREKELIKQIVAKKTWRNQILRTSEKQKRSLFTWMESIKRIGKGTGKQAAKYRKMAQIEMEKCKEAIPVWIMPINKVIENISLENHMFDVVIFDESSQNDISAISALMRAKRAIIVGDEMQISPEAIGKDNEMVENLINRYLKDVPHSEWFDLKTSLYNTALRVFPSRLVLKEHFRCSPEIIEFSNGLCYSNEIIPLRCPKPSETFVPSIIPVKVQDGERDTSKGINMNEAKALVDTLISCCKNDRYKDMSMGVISLLGDSQSELIENMLKEQLGIEEMIKRKIICGDAYSFQGDERDIIFLSMGIANNAKFMALTKESDVRRFNVAASRARNQMWLFHSVDLENLNAKCVRASLLSYFLDPARNNAWYKTQQLPLEGDIYSNIHSTLLANGFDVKQNVKIGKYYIDFILEGANSRIAIDVCKDTVEQNSNSTTTSTSSNLTQAQNRRLSLQKVGWNFYIIRESEFIYNKAATLEALKTLLNQK